MDNGSSRIGAADREAGEKYRAIFDNSIEGMYQASPNGGFISANRSLATMLGYDSPEELIGSIKSIGEEIYANPYDRETVRQLLHRDGAIRNFEVQCRKKDGTLFWVVINLRRVLDKDGNVAYHEGTGQDITERKAAEAELGRLAAIVEFSHDAIIALTPAGAVTSWNPAAQQIFGFSAAEMVGKPIARLIPAELKIEEEWLLSRVARGEAVEHYDTVRTHKSGRRIDVSLTISPIKDSQGRIIGVSKISRDITEYKLAAKTLQQQTGELAALNLFGRAVNTNVALAQTATAALQGILSVMHPDLVCLFLRDGERLELVEMLPQAARDRMPAMPEHYVGQCICGIAVKEGRVTYSRDIFNDSRCSFDECKNSGFTSFAALPLHGRGEVVGVIGLASEQERDFEQQGDFLETLAGHTSIALTNALLFESARRELDRRQRTEDALRESEFFFRESQRAAMIGSYKANIETDSWESSEVLDLIFGISVGYVRNMKGWIDLIHPDDRETMSRYVRDEVIGGRKPLNKEYRIIRKSDGQTRWVNARGEVGFDEGDKPKTLLGTVQDVSERKETEMILHQTQRLDSLGLLAGGIAHDFNNLMAGIFGYIDLAAGSMCSPEVREYLNSALSSLNRARGLTHQLLTFAKGGAPVLRAGRLFPLVKEVAQFALSGSAIICRFDIRENLWPCWFDRDQIAQVVDNIVINAQQAMPAGGSIMITAQNIDIPAGTHAYLQEGGFVVITITDTGTGIPAELLPRIFDPFFTTKTKGHGLGLATCYSIMKRHNGCIEVESEQGRGTTFRLYLPVAAGEIVEAPQLTAGHSGCGTVIVMDDEDAVRKVMMHMAGNFGYETVGAKDGIEAVELFRKFKSGECPVCCIILDLTVPGGHGGREAVAEIRKMDATLPVFVASGYSDDPVMKNPADYGFTASISKPFVKSELAVLFGKHLGKQAELS